MTSSTPIYNPFAERNVKHPTNDFETFVHLVKAALGAGIFAMPVAFQRIGIWLGIPATIFICILATYCVHMLVNASQTLCYRSRIARLSYADTAEQAFLNDPKDFKKLAQVMRYVVNISLIVNMLGCISIYFVNAGRNLEQVLAEHYDAHFINLRIVIAIVAVPMLFLSLIRDLKYLVPFSLVANVFMFTSLIITFCFVFADLPNPSEREAIADYQTWPSFFCIAIFALEIVGIVIPCENEMKTPQHFTGCPSVLVAAMCVVSTLYTFLGFFGYWKYGDEIEANITLNLPKGNGWAEAAKICIAFAIYFTILLQFYCAMQIIWHSLKEKVPEKWQMLTENVVRFCLMLCCAIIAVIFPDLGPFITLVGAVSFSTLGFTLPALIDLIVFRIDPGYGFLKMHLIKDILIILFSLSIFVAGTFESINEFQIESFRL